jgi:predicted ribosome quality control (RQC) complex YloA/Tae2 family protein
MSLNWKEIDLILRELDLEGAQIQGVVQSAFDVLVLRAYKMGITKQVLVSLSPGACRIHETFKAVPKTNKPLRFAQFCNSKIVNGRIVNITQLGDNRIVKMTVKRAEQVFYLYIRLWSNAANIIVTDENALVLDAMRRRPKKGEVTGGSYLPEIVSNEKREYEIRELEGDGSFNRKIDAFYAQQGGSLSLAVLHEQARRDCENRIGRINTALAKLREKEAQFQNAGQLKTYGDLILSNLCRINPRDKWLEVEDMGQIIRIELDPNSAVNAQAERYYEQYRKAKTGLAQLQREIADSENELLEIEAKLKNYLNETNPLILAKLLKTPVSKSPGKKEKKRPGLEFKKDDWLILVGRDAAENDELLRRHVKGNDTWLHSRDYHGSYVFIKQCAGKSIPLDILLDAGNLAIFYSKGRNSSEGDLFYTQVKYLRRAKNGPKGLVIPTQEKNLRVKVDKLRLRTLESCKV